MEAPDAGEQGGEHALGHARAVTHYELLEKLGEGGMGSVYKARDLRLERPVALKFPLPRLLDSPDERSRFLREGRALSSLSHPNIATVFEVDEAGGAPFLALEYLPGGTLRDRIRALSEAGSHVPLPQVLEWTIAAAEGLAHAHRHGVVHRDVKSANVMFDAEGRPKLTDFGLARMTSAPDPSTSGTVAGTLAYMSPEQAAGGPVDHRSDLYSLGVVAYELATGRLPFQGDSSSDLFQHVMGSPPSPPSQFRDDLPVVFDQVVVKLLAKSPARRYQRAEDMIRDLQALRPPSRQMTPEATTVRMRAPSKFRLTRRGWIVAAAALVVVIAAITWDAGRRWLQGRALPKQIHLAVLPFQAAGNDESLRAYADGLMVALTRALAGSAGLLVVSAADSRRLESAEQARDEFGANLVLAGMVQDIGELRRVTLHLAGTGTSSDFGSVQVVRLRSQLQSIQADALAKAAALLHLTLPAEPQTAQQTRVSQVPAAQAAYTLGDGYLYRQDRQGALERARLQFEEAIKLDPKFAPAFVGLAETHMGDYEYRREPGLLQSALEVAKRAVELDPGYADAHSVLGSIFNASGQPQSAAEELETALKLEPGNHSAYRELGKLYESRRRFQEAERTYQQGIRAFPGEWQCRLQLADFYINRQREADAERVFVEATQVAPDNSVLYRNLATALSRLGRNREAIEKLRQSLALREGARAYSNLGAVLMFERRYTEALDAMQRAVAIAARDGLKSYTLWGNLGDVYWLTKANPEKMRAAWQQAIQVGEQQLRGSAGDAELLGILANYHAKLGNRRECEARLTQALQYAPDSARVHYQASLAWTLLGEKERGLAELAEAVRLGYSVPEIRKAPELESLRSDPKFENILTRAGRR